jgi:hypothetical protein
VLGALGALGANAGGCSLFLGDDGLSGGGAVGDGGVEGGSSLPPPQLVDCADPATNSDIRCRTIDSLQPGSVGGGPLIDWFDGYGNLRLEVVGGALRGTELLLGLRRDDPTGEGGVLGVSLQTGERRLISGSLRRPDGQFWQTGTGNGFQDLAGLSVGASGQISLLLNPPFGGFSGFIMDVSEPSGDRTTRSVGQTCSQLLPDTLFPNPGSYPALAPDTTAYFAAQNIQGGWLVRVLGEQCELVGQLPLPSSAEGMAWHAGKLWMVDQLGSTLASLDTTSGQIDVVSASTSPSPGLEERPIGSAHVAVAPDGVYGVGGELINDFRLVHVDPISGARTVLPDNLGPARTVVKTRQLVWAHPTQAALVLVIDGAVVIYDPKTGNNNVLSF